MWEVMRGWWRGGEGEECGDEEGDEGGESMRRSE